MFVHIAENICHEPHAVIGCHGYRFCPDHSKASVQPLFKVIQPGIGGFKVHCADCNSYNLPALQSFLLDDLLMQLLKDAVRILINTLLRIEPHIA